MDRSISFMHSVVKLRTVNGSLFLSVPKDLGSKLTANYLAVRLDESGRLIYTPVSEVA